ncbi:MAG: flavodoxin family protein [Desulfovibrio sp.]|jgi:multimeric flavodoxin WrbA|nr:flavodoxin family protein [Desulfovibrio sp.]
MYALAINGSPRKKGNTETLLDAVLRPLREAGWETELFHLGGKDIKGCIACGQCAEKLNGRCINNSDVFNSVMGKMIRANAIIIGSPTYFADVTAETKALIDRSGYTAMANGRIFAGKIGAAVVAARRGGAIHVFDSINHLFSISQMIVPGSSYWNMGYGLDRGDAQNDAEALDNMGHLGQAINWLGQAIAAHREPYPVLR